MAQVNFVFGDQGFGSLVEFILFYCNRMKEESYKNSSDEEAKRNPIFTLAMLASGQQTLESNRAIG